jgi:hypothetical protein
LRSVTFNVEPLERLALEKIILERRSLTRKPLKLLGRHHHNAIVAPATRCGPWVRAWFATSLNRFLASASFHFMGASTRIATLSIVTLDRTP